MNKKLKLTKLTVANLQRTKAGIDPVCFCLHPDIDPLNEAYNQIGGLTGSPFCSMVKTVCGQCTG